jgi:pyridoxamine 5'-phosphate oxidase
MDEASLPHDPFVQFARWFQDAAQARIREPAAMTLATADSSGRPSARIVLLRGYDERGFVFFTNYESRKGTELEDNPRAAFVFYWDVLERQVRIEGEIARLDAHESDAYFAQRPRGHQLSAWASRQSRLLTDRAVVEAEMKRYDVAFAGREVERPPYWGGYRVCPELFEFWQGRANRVHDRITYVWEKTWRVSRLSP